MPTKTFSLAGTLDISQLKTAVNNLLLRHTNLRAAFIYQGLENPVQIVTQDVEVPWKIHDLSSLAPIEQHMHLERLMTEDLSQRFDLSKPPLMRFTLLILLLLLFFRSAFTPVTAAAPADAERMKFAGTLAVLRGDQRLLLFTLGGIFSTAVYGPLLTYLSQYLIVVETASVAYETVAYLSAANAVVVISLQYLFGSWIKEEKLLAWVSLVSAAFVVGLIGLSLSQELWIWVFAIIIFTIGEIIIVPAEYMFIDKIAPNHLARDLLWHAKPRLHGSRHWTNCVRNSIEIRNARCNVLRLDQHDVNWFVVLLRWLPTGRERRKKRCSCGMKRRTIATEINMA